jgi:hypothetical protein
MLTIQKAMDEGTAEPFIARLVFGMLSLRDQVFQQESLRQEFDSLYEPVLEALFAMRKAVRDIRNQITQHERRTASGEIIRWQRNAMAINESINAGLRDDLGRFLNSAVRAIKLLQNVASLLNLNIGGLFAKEQNFQRQMKDLEAKGRAELAAYLRESRSHWSERLTSRRNALEHEGWTLDTVRYSVAADRTVQVCEPTVDSQRVSDWVTAQAAHVIVFVEDILMYGFQQMLPPYVAVVEIPLGERDPNIPTRFNVGFPQIQVVVRWVLRYDPVGFR